MLDYVEKGVEIMKNLVPPKTGASDRHVRNWRMWMAGVTVMNAAGLVAHIAIACGFVTSIHSGFAESAEVEKLATEFRQTRINSLENNILEMWQKQCAAPDNIRPIYTTQLQKMLAEYVRLNNGTPYPQLPSCRA